MDSPTSPFQLLYLFVVGVSPSSGATPLCRSPPPFVVPLLVYKYILIHPIHGFCYVRATRPEARGSSMLHYS